MKREVALNKEESIEYMKSIFEKNDNFIGTPKCPRCINWAKFHRRMRKYWKVNSCDAEQATLMSDFFKEFHPDMNEHWQSCYLMFS